MAKRNAINNQSADLTIDPGASGDSFAQLDINSTGKFRIGVDDDDSDNFKIASGSALGTNDRYVLDSNGVAVIASQPSFHNTINAEANASGDGTAHSIGSITSTTSVFDRGSDMTEGDGAGTGAIFTAPVDGVYLFQYSLQIDIDGTSGGDWWQTYIVASAGTYMFTDFPTENRITDFFGVDGDLASSGHLVIEMSASDTAEFFFKSANNSKVDDIVDGWLSGGLIA